MKKWILLLVLATQPFYIYYVVKKDIRRHHYQLAIEHFRKSEDLITQSAENWRDKDTMDKLLNQAHAEFVLGQNEMRAATNK